MNWFILAFSLSVIVYAEIKRKNAYSFMDKKIEEMKILHQNFAELSKMMGDDAVNIKKEGDEVNEYHTVSDICNIPNSLHLPKRKIN